MMQIINERRQDKVVGEHLSYHDDIVTGAVATREGLQLQWTEWAVSRLQVKHCDEIRAQYGPNRIK